MCDFCENTKQLLAKEVSTTVWNAYTGEEEIQVIIDRGYLRLGYTEDMQCMDHGEKIKINFCPVCGKKFGDID